MCFVSVVDHGSTVGISGGKLRVVNSEGKIREVPLESIEGISIFFSSSIEYSMY